MYSQDELLPISALQHLLFCPRQCALIHLEGLWVENVLTQQGRRLHKRSDEGPSERSPTRRILRGLPLRSLKLGLIGKADVVELHRIESTPADSLEGDRTGVVVPGAPGRWRILPVEYKRGQPKRNDADRVQICAQALCLEEMFDGVVTTGDLFYGTSKRRVAVPFDDRLRRTTLDAIERLRDMIGSRKTPPAVREKKCDSCSLLELCMPDVTGGGKSIGRWLQGTLVKASQPGPEAL